MPKRIKKWVIFDAIAYQGLLKYQISFPIFKVSDRWKFQISGFCVSTGETHTSNKGIFSLMPNRMEKWIIFDTMAYQRLLKYSGEIRPGSKPSSFAHVKKLAFLFPDILNKLGQRKLPEGYILTIIAKYTIICKIICKLGSENVDLCLIFEAFVASQLSMKIIFCRAQF